LRSIRNNREKEKEKKEMNTKTSKSYRHSTEPWIYVLKGHTEYLFAVHLTIYNHNKDCPHVEKDVLLKELEKLLEKINLEVKPIIKEIKKKLNYSEHKNIYITINKADEKAKLVSLEQIESNFIHYIIEFQKPEARLYKKNTLNHWNCKQIKH